MTGDNASNLLGTLGVDGDADLFLLNPNGIVFGSLAEVDVEGTFYGIAAESINIGDESFSALSPVQNQLLAVRPSVSFETYLTENLSDVNSRETLNALGSIVLIGNNLNIQSQISAEEDITLFASENINFDDAELITNSSSNVSNIGEIKLQAEQDITLANTRISSSLSSDSLAERGGDITINARNLYIEEASTISSNSIGSGDTGKIDISVDETVRLTGPLATINSNALGNRNGGSRGIDINAQNILLENLAFISAVASNPKTPGIIDLNAQDTIALNDFSFINPEDICAFLSSCITGAINVTSSSLLLDNASQINGFVIGKGTAGDITLRIDNDISLTNEGTPILLNGSPLISAIGSRVLVGGEGRSGNIEIEAENLSLTGSQISASVLGRGETGKIKLDIGEMLSVDNANITSSINFGAEGNSQGIEIDAGSLFINGDSGIIDVVQGAIGGSMPAGRGSAGDIDIDVENSVLIDGEFLGSIDGRAILPANIATAIAPGASGIGGDIRLQAQEVVLQDFATIRSTLDLGATGEAGDISIETERLFLDQSQLVAATDGRGNAGRILLDIESLVSLDNQSIITSALPQ